MNLAVICAIARDGSIGKDGALPWGKLRCDMQFFRYITTATHPEKVAYHFVHYPHTVDIARTSNNYALHHTTGNACIMGWRTHQSIGSTLKQRTSIVLRDTTYHGFGDWPCKARTFNEALENAARLHAPNVFAIGGTRVFASAMRHPKCTHLYITEVDAQYPDADTWFPWMGPNWNDGILYTYDDGRKMQHWFARHHVSEWIQEDERPRYRLAIWERCS